MKLTIDVDVKKIKIPIEQFKERLQTVAVKTLQRVGEESITIARNLGSEYKLLTAEELEQLRHKPHQPNYIDDTGNLRQSIGYLVAVNGDVKTADLQNSQAEDLANGVLATVGGNEVTLVMVAGMEYASDVSERGYDVLDSAAINAKNKFVELSKQIF